MRCHYGKELSAWWQAVGSSVGDKTSSVTKRWFCERILWRNKEIPLQQIMESAIFKRLDKYDKCWIIIFLSSLLFSPSFHKKALGWGAFLVYATHSQRNIMRLSVFCHRTAHSFLSLIFLFFFVLGYFKKCLISFFFSVL